MWLGLSWAAPNRSRGSARWAIAGTALLALLCLLGLRAGSERTATVFATVFVLGVARVILSVGADRVYPLERDLWQAPALGSFVELLRSLYAVWPTWAALVLPFVALGLGTGIARLVSRGSKNSAPLKGQSDWFRSSRRFWGVTFALGLGLLIWLAPGKERIEGLGFLKSVVYLPVLSLLAGWLAGPGDWRYAQATAGRVTALDWSRLLIAFIIACAVHTGLAVVASDLGAVLAIGPVAAVVLIQVFSVENTKWRVLLATVLVLVAWGFFSFASAFTSLIAEGREETLHMPWLTWVTWTLAGALCSVALWASAGTRTALGPKARLTRMALAAAIVMPLLPTVGKVTLGLGGVQHAIQSHTAEYYVKYVRLRSNDATWLKAEGTQKAMEVYGDLELVRNYGKGGMWGEGYLSPPIPTKHDNFLNDYMLTVFVKGQFGMVGLGALMGAFLALVLWGGSLPDHLTHRPGQLFWLMTARAAAWIWGGISLFMAASNLGWLPLTGKNATLLGLNSGSDVVEALVLATLMLLGARVVESRRKATPVAW